MHAQPLLATPPRGLSSDVRRRGFASVMAMLYMVLFATLAIGFYATTTLSVQVARNERTLTQAQYAAESGMQFMRYQLGNLAVPVATPQNQLLGVIATQLGQALNSQLNLNGDTVGFANNTISIPSQSSHYITLDPNAGTRFQATITLTGINPTVTVTGRGNDSTVLRTIQLQFQYAYRASTIFNFGVASAGKVTTAGASYIIGTPDKTKGSVLSTTLSSNTPISIGGKQVSGDLFYTNPAGSVTYAGASVGGTSDPVQIALHHVHQVSAPLFPAVDSRAYAAYATNSFAAGQKSYTNVTIPPQGSPVNFTGNTTLTGVIYVQMPNVLNFKGNTTLQGVIVVQNNDPISSPPDLVHNQINFTGSVSVTGVQTLPASYGNLRTLTGAFILAPGFGLSFSGNFGSVSGSIIASQITMSGNATGTVQGSVIGVNDVPMSISGSSDIYIASTGTTNYPQGVTFGSKYTPIPGSYTEIVP